MCGSVISRTFSHPHSCLCLDWKNKFDWNTEEISVGHSSLFLYYTRLQNNSDGGTDTKCQIYPFNFEFNFVYSILEKILGKVLVRGVGYFLYELHVLVGADPSGTTTVCAEEESRLLFSFATLLVSCF